MIRPFLHHRPVYLRIKRKKRIRVKFGFYTAYNSVIEINRRIAETESIFVFFLSFNAPFDNIDANRPRD